MFLVGRSYKKANSPANQWGEAFLATKFSFGSVWTETRFIAIISRYVETNKEDRWNPNEKKTRDKSEVGGFHDHVLLSRKLSPAGAITPFMSEDFN